MKRVPAFWLVIPLILAGCATSTEGLTKNQIADRERARNARISFYSQVASGIARGAMETYGYKK